MPKLKTHKTAAKRFYITGTGKILRAKVGKSHLRRKKTKRTKRTFSQKLPVSNASLPKIKQLLGGGL